MKENLMAKIQDAIPFIADDTVQIQEMSWERIFLNIKIKSAYKEEMTFSFVNMRFNMNETDPEDTWVERQRTAMEGATIRILSEYPIDYESYEDGIYNFHINLSSLNGANFMENARWRIIGRIPGDETAHITTISYEAVYELPELSRIFPYGKGKYSYNVFFTKLCNDAVNIIPSMNTKFMIENPKWEELYVVGERRTLKGKFKCVLKKFKLSLMQTAYNIMSAMNSKPANRILLMSETKPFLWGNLKFLDARIKERKLDEKFKMSYTFRVAVGENNSIFNWFKTLRLIAKQDFIFVDDYCPIFGWLKLRQSTKLIQVWHAGVGFKAVGYGRFGQTGSPKPVGSCHRAYDYVITGSQDLVEVYSEVFGLPEERILPLGMARLDNFLDKDVTDAAEADFYGKYPECKGKKIILFSPTFRGSNQKMAYYDYTKLDMDRIYEFCGDEYIWMFKMHPFIKDKPPIEKRHEDRIIDLSHYKNINDLYYVTDIMITDYSSAYYEFSLMNRPILFYTYDRVIYENIRGVHKSIKEDAPGKVCDTFDEMMKALEDKDYELEKTTAFKEANFSNFDGHAADRIIDTLLLPEE